MKKLLKFVGTVAALSAVVAGGVALYKKFFAPEEDFSDLDDDFDDEFEDEDLDSDTQAERGYVSLNNTVEAVKMCIRDSCRAPKQPLPDSSTSSRSDSGIFKETE